MRPRTPLTLIAVLLLATSWAHADGNRVSWMAKKLLSGQDIVDYELAIKRFVSQSDPIVRPTLLKMLESDNTIGRAEAAGVLWQYNSKDVRQKLLGLKEDPEAVVRIEAAKSLCLMKFIANLDTVSTELKSKEQSERNRAFRALAQIGGPEASEAVAQAPKAKTAADRVWQAYARYQLVMDQTKQLALLEKTLLSLPRAALLSGKRNPSEDDLERAARLAAPGLANRLEASQALSRIGNEEALAILVRGTADLASRTEPNGAMRRLLRHRDDAALALVKGLGDDRVLVRLGSAQVAARLRLKQEAGRNSLSQALGQTLQDRSRLVRLAAMKAISKHGFSEKSNQVAQLLDSADPASRRLAALTLGALDQERHLETLLKRLDHEKVQSVRRGLYGGIAAMRSGRAVKPLLNRLKKLYKQRRRLAAGDDELRLCTKALAAAGDPAAERVLKMLPKLKDEKRKLLEDVLAETGSAAGIGFFLDVLRESPPDPDSAAVRFFDSLGRQHLPRLKSTIETETAMWIRVILARALFRLGEKKYSRGILWGLNHEDAYFRMLAAAMARGLRLPGAIKPLIRLMGDKPRTAWYAARALMSDGSAKATAGLLTGLEGAGLRERTPVPLKPFWEGARSARHPYAKEVDNDRVWVLFAEDRLGGKLDLFLTWSADGSTWTKPVFTGLTSFADPGGNVAPPTFSLQVRGRKITIALTRTFAQSNNPKKPRFKTLQRVKKHKWQDFFKDRDKDGLKDSEEQARYTSPRRSDTDGDGLEDGEDKNPLAKPAETRDDDLVKLLAFSHALLVAEAIPINGRLLVVENTPATRRAPELPTWPWLVLHLAPEQYKELWRNTGGGFPRVRFSKTSFSQGRRNATVVIDVYTGPGDRQSMEVEMRKRNGQWIVRGLTLRD